MTENKFGSATKKMTSGKAARAKLRTRIEKFRNLLTEMLSEFDELRKQAEETPGTIYWENKHPELFPQNPRW